MKTHTLPPLRTILFLWFGLISVSAAADAVLKSKADLIGTWKLNHTSPQLDGKQRPSQQEWEFREDGTLISTASDKRAKGSFTVTVPYEISDDTVTTGMAGRPGKKVTYTVIKKEGNELILKGGPDGYLFFTKQ